MTNVVAIKIVDLKPFSEKIFSPYEGMRLDEMVESVKSYGIITPIIVREMDGAYEILSGSNRVKAAEIIGLDTVPAVNKGVLDDWEARFIVTESNIQQRGFMEMSISERAKCIYVRQRAMKRQGLRKAFVREIEMLLEGQNEEVVAFDVNKSVADDFDLSPRNVRRYLRVHALVDELKILVDTKVIGFSAAVELSYLESEHQSLVVDVVEENDFAVSIKQAKALRQLETDENFTQDKVFFILVKETMAEPTRVRISQDLMKRYFTGYKTEEIMDVLEQALEAWFGDELRVIGK